ncbi:hypothetical protein [Candidatus Uabimicrobium sp. HlEnr_7]|uniref:hypothetical protein n=1 Tax=Candidatus Uabimicrobium helgolandensis TaxID=3095367 RepID=UPI0035589563
MLSDDYILEQAIARKWLTQEQIDLCSIEKSKDQSVLDVLVAKDFLSKEQVDKLTWEELDDDDCFLSSDLKLKVMSVDDLDAEMNKTNNNKEQKKNQDKTPSSQQTKDPLNTAHSEDPLLIGEGSAIAAHAIIGEDSSFEEPVFGEGSTFVKPAAFAEEVLESQPEIDTLDQKMRKSSVADEEILEFDNDFLESNFENPAFRASDPIEAEEEASKELDALRLDSAEFTISGNVALPEFAEKTTTREPKKPVKKQVSKKVTPAPAPAPKNKSKKAPSEKVSKIKSQYSKPSQGKSMSTPFGKAAILLKMATEEQVNDALLSQVTDCKGKKIGKIMAEKGYLTNEQIKTILSRQKTSTMICPVCEKRYQIVLFQAGRSYRCKSSKCPKKPELLELRKYLKKRKKSIDISHVPKDVEVMGLTGEISLKRKKPKKDPLEASQEEMVTTPELLKDVGIQSHEVANIEIEETTKSSKFFLVFMLLIVVGGSGYFAHHTGLMDKFLAKYLNTTEKMQEDYSAIISNKYKTSDKKEVLQRITAFNNFQKDYPKNPYKREIAKELLALEQLLTQSDSISDFEKLTAEINASILNEKFNSALSVLRNFKDENPSYSSKKISNLTRFIKNKSKEKLDIVLNKFDELLANKQYDEAKNLLIENKSGQLLGNLEIINSKLNSIIRLQQQIEWLDIAQQIAKKTYPLLKSRKYKQAQSIVKSSAGDNPQLQLWSNCVGKLPNVSKSFQGGMSKLKGKTTTLYFDIQTKTRSLAAPLANFNYSKWQILLGSRTLSISSLNHKSIAKIIRYKERKHSSFDMALFCCTWKDKLYVQNIEGTEKEILALYVFENYKYNIKRGKLNGMLNSLVTIKSLKDTQVYSIKKEQLASALKNVAARKTKLKNRLYSLIKKYFADTQVARNL